MMFNQKVQEKRVEYKELKNCILKKEAGETTEKCKELFKELGIKDEIQ